MVDPTTPITPAQSRKRKLQIGHVVHRHDSYHGHFISFASLDPAEAEAYAANQTRWHAEHLTERPDSVIADRTYGVLPGYFDGGGRYAGPLA